MNKKVIFICQGAMIAAIYVVLTLFINTFNLASGAIQVRISEALCILPTSCYTRFIYRLFLIKYHDGKCNL